MAIEAVTSQHVAAQVEDIAKPRRAESTRTSDDGSHVEGDRVEISEEGRAKAAAMQGEQSGTGDDTGGGKEDGEGGERTTFTMKSRSGGESGEAEKEDAVDELEDTNSEIKRTEDKLQEAKTSSMHSEEEREREIEKLEQELRDLEDTKKELESTLAS